MPWERRGIRSSAWRGHAGPGDAQEVSSVGGDKVRESAISSAGTARWRSNLRRWPPAPPERQKITCARPGPAASLSLHKQHNCQLEAWN